MTHEGPQLDPLLHRLAECPPEFLLPPLIGGRGEIDVAAIVCDQFRDWSPESNFVPTSGQVTSLRAASAEHQRLMAVATWLLHDDWFLARPALSSAAWDLLLSDSLQSLSKLVRADVIVNDADRREELTRVCLRALGLRPFGETEAQALDRLTTLDSVERDRVIRNTRSAEARTRQIREAMARKAAQEAAARYSPE